MLEGLEKLVGRQVVVDTDTHLVYLGKLTRVGKDYLMMEEVDVHSVHDSQTSREIYVMETRKFGVRHNRRSVIVLMNRVVSISSLEDVLDF